MPPVDLLTRSLLRSTTLSTASGKEEILLFFFFTLFPRSEERVEQRSAFGVSKWPPSKYFYLRLLRKNYR
jgi:hypothetical protein